MEIKKIRLFVKENEKCEKVASELKEKLIHEGFFLSEDDSFDLGIAVGGDGTFLRMIRESHFLPNTYYVGVNLGTLGFAQDVEYHEINLFIEQLKRGEFFYEDIGVQTISIEMNDKKEEFHALNEFVIRDEELKTIHLDVYINDILLENYVGDGILVSTSFGSTAYNLSFGGSMVFNEFDTLQITPIAPILNKSYPTLANALVLPSTKEIKLVPEKNSIILTIDGITKSFSNVQSIKTSIDRHIRLIRKKDYNYIKKINDKFIK